MDLNQQVAELDKLIEVRFREHRDFEVITSMPGLGVILGAEFLAATGGDMATLALPTGSPASGASPRHHRPPGISAAICGVRSDTTAASNASSTPRRYSGPTMP